MAFNFAWNQFSDSFVHNAETLLSAALNKGTKPSIIADDISVKELNMGTKVFVFQPHTLTAAARARADRAWRIGTR